MIYLVNREDLLEFRLAKKFHIYRKEHILDITEDYILCVSGPESELKELKKIFLIVFRNLEFNEDGSLKKFEEDFSELRKIAYKKTQMYTNRPNSSALLILVQPHSYIEREISILLLEIPSTIKEILRLLN